MCENKTAITIFLENRNLEVLPDNTQYKHRFYIPSSSSNNKYTIAQRKSDGVWTCNCRGWLNARNGHHNRKCKHITELKPLLESVSQLEKKEIG